MRHDKFMRNYKGDGLVARQLQVVGKNGQLNQVQTLKDPAFSQVE